MPRRCIRHLYGFLHASIALLMLIALRAPVQAGELAWTRTLGGIGFRDGLTGTGDTGTLKAYFHIPEAARHAGTIALELNTFLRPGLSAELAIAVNDIPRQILSLQSGNRHTSVTIAVEETDVAGGLVALRLSYARARRRDCSEDEANSLTVKLAPSSALSIPLPAGAITTAADALALMPDEVLLTLPPAPLTAREYETALRIAVALEQQSRKVTFLPDARSEQNSGHVELTRADAIRAGAANQRPLLVLPSVLDGKKLEDLIARHSRTAPISADALPIRALGGETGLRQVLSSADWTVPLVLNSFPAGTIPGTLRLLITTPADPGNTHLLHVYLDDIFIASRHLRSQGRTHVVEIPIPQERLGISSTAHIVFERVDSASACTSARRAAPVALLDDSTVESRRISNPRKFADLVPMFGTGVTIGLPARFLEHPRETLPFVTALARDFVRAPFQAELSFSDGAIRNSGGPFIQIADFPPPNAKLALRLDRGPISILDQAKAAIVTLNDDGAGTLAQLVTADGQSGIWIKPNMRLLPRLTTAPAPSRGNVALIDADGVALWFDTEAPRGLVVDYGDRDRLAAFLSRNWPWVLGASWLLLVSGLVARAPRSRPK